MSQFEFENNNVVVAMHAMLAMLACQTGGKDDMGENNNSNDNNTDILAQSMRRVFQEAVQEGAVPFDERRDGLNKRVDTTDKNVRTDKKQD